MNSPHAFMLVGYILQERFEPEFFRGSSGSLDEMRCSLYRRDLVGEAIMAVGGNADGRSVTVTRHGERLLLSVSLKRALVEHPVTPTVQAATGQVCFSGYLVEVDVSLDNDSDTFLASLRLLLDPQAKQLVAENEGRVFIAKAEEGVTIIAASPFLNEEYIRRCLTHGEAPPQDEVDPSKLN